MSNSNKTAKFTAPGMSNDSAEKTISTLDNRMVALINLQLTLKHIHWTVVGPNFICFIYILDPPCVVLR